eukprot:GHVU01048444.1.p1 GENE.GHVU01048444.1~~GHVU01048444.1.p1  ORF type:complete len:367 (-),score=96.67 GHVU01048444.1:83-1183(-)
MSVLSATFEDGSFFKRLVKSFDKVVGEFHFSCDDEGINYLGMDPSQVALFGLTLSSGAFRSYAVSTGGSRAGPVFMGLSVAKLQGLLKPMPDDAELSLALDAVHGPLRIRSVKAGITYSAELPLIDLDREFVEEPSDGQFSLNINFRTKLFTNVMKELNALSGSTVTLSFAEKDGVSRLILRSDDNSHGQIKLVLKSGMDGVSEWEHPSGIDELSFDLTFLTTHVVPLCAVSDEVSLGLGPDVRTMRLLFPLRGDSRCVFYLGSKVNEEGDPAREKKEVKNEEAKQAEQATRQQQQEEAAAAAGRRAKKEEPGDEEADMLEEDKTKDVKPKPERSSQKRRVKKDEAHEDADGVGFHVYVDCRLPLS